MRIHEYNFSFITPCSLVLTRVLARNLCKKCTCMKRAVCFLAY